MRPLPPSNTPQKHVHDNEQALKKIFLWYCKMPRKSPKIYYDMVRQGWRYEKGSCTPILSQTTYRSRSAKTPRYEARHCTGMVRLGRDGKTLYVSARIRKRLPYSERYRISNVWKVVYDRKTEKKYDVFRFPKRLLDRIS